MEIEYMENNDLLLKIYISVLTLRTRLILLPKHHTLLSQHLFHNSKQSASPLLESPFNSDFGFVKKQKSQGVRSGLYGRLTDLGDAMFC